MREIKFRVWDGVKIVSLSRATTDGLVVIQHDDDNSIWSNELREDYDDVKLMQYTGLKDKNGVKIYEGDIMQGKDYEEETIRGEVVFDKGSFYIDLSKCEYPNSLLCLSNDEDEVIGNVYENKELLDEN